jgi:transcription elongation factor SPT6
LCFFPFEGARDVMAKEIAFEPLVREALREQFIAHAVVNTELTLRGMKEIDPFHPYRVRISFTHSFSINFSTLNSFLYLKHLQSKSFCLQIIKRLKDKPITAFKNSDQFLMILKAEKEGFIKMTIELPPEAFEKDFKKPMELCFLSESTDAIADAWNTQRKLVHFSLSLSLSLSLSSLLRFHVSFVVVSDVEICSFL